MQSLLVLASIVAASFAAQPSVTIKNGTVRGVDLPQNGQSLFLGIPFAQPPVGELRLRPPRSINASFGTLDATAYGPHCWDSFTTGFDDNSGFNNSEDCLTLNVIQPYGVSEHKPVPVLVWIHGGGFFTGGSADYRYNGTYLVEASVANGKPIVFVSMNYRLASFGFLGGSALAEEGSLNLGIRDQRLALHWVQENIKKFGGDPTRVTIQGQSAGGMSVNTQVVAYSGRNDKLFHQAIVESGSYPQSYADAKASTYQATFNRLLTNTTCSNTVNGTGAEQLACIRSSLSAEEFRATAVGATSLFNDGDILATTSPFAGYRAGKWNRVAFLMGSNTDEGRSFAPLGANTTAEVTADLSRSVPNSKDLDKLLELYPDEPALGCPFNTGDFQLNPIQNGAFGTPGAQNKRVQAITGDIMMAAGPRLLGQLLSKEVPFYKYRFNHVPWSVSFSVEDFIGHFTEVGYAFNTQNNDTDFWITNHFTATYLGPTAPIEDRFLGVYMSRSWAAFAATGDPNNANVTTKLKWPKYSEGAENIVWQTQGSMIEKDDYRQEGMQYIIDNVIV
ncbi:Carboxylic ester hydrolase [Mycena chlorophos]|uniref:Carboxylic ester hydrolase n=1 Tax=Mycena chlorophos TaxID=658473 RepID=A0A8H6TNB5_MYCCL|nr:Carboxylic ester hydrolase [Mycena chlorophos]